MREFSWDDVRAGYRERRLSEGATPEEIDAEILPPDLVVWSTQQLKIAKQNANSQVSDKPQRQKKTKTPPRWGKDGSLTPRDIKQIMECHDRGMSSSETARHLGINSRTVKKYLKADGRQLIDGRSTRHLKKEYND